MSQKEFKLPDLGEGIHEGDIIAVRVAVGDRVTENDVILEIETDKATVEIPSPYTGAVSEVRVKAGEVVQVGQVLLVFETDARTGPAAGPAEEKAAPAPQQELQKDPTLPATKIPGEETPGRHGPVPASPATRRLARELGVDLTRIAGSGAAGLVTAEDVRAYDRKGPAEESGATFTHAAQSPAFAPAMPETIPYKSVRRAIGKQMARAWAEIPHVTTQDEVDITRLELLRQRHKAWVTDQGGHLSMTVLILKAAIQVLKTYPNFNASLDLEAGVIRRYREYHLGVAVDTPDGLIVPVVHHADQNSILDLSIKLKDLVTRTRERKVGLEELQGGTFTITNVGREGGSFFTPIINHPQVAILGVGGARVRPVMVKAGGGELKTVPRLILPLTLTIDHRVLDGADAGRFLKLLKQMLRDPETFLLQI